MIVNGSMIEVTPDEAIVLATRLLASAQKVKEASRKLPDAYCYERFSGVDTEGKQVETFRVRIGRSL